MKLLVSVQNQAEVAAAVTGGADLIDVKNTATGALGMANPDVLLQVARTLGGHREQIPLSAALGELSEWTPQRIATPQPAIAGHYDYVKTGLAGMQQQTNWFRKWQQVRQLFPEQCHWVTVAYADADRSRSPDIDTLIEAATAIGSEVLLIDTWKKDGSCLFDWCSEEQLHWVRQQTREAGIQLALAGQLRISHTPVLQRIAPDIVAVRGAVCETHQRSGQMNAELVSQLRTRMDLPIVDQAD